VILLLDQAAFLPALILIGQLLLGKSPHTISKITPIGQSVFLEGTPLLGR